MKSLINVGPAAQPNPHQQFVDQTIAKATHLFNELQRLQDSVAKELYGSESIDQAQARVDAFGDKAASLFTLSSSITGIRQFVTGVRTNVMPAGWSYAVNADGTVKLMNQPAVQAKPTPAPAPSNTSQGLTGSQSTTAATIDIPSKPAVPTPPKPADANAATLPAADKPAATPDEKATATT